jgi:N-terminal acetyltransferase B complex catalytic subunit
MNILEALSGTRTLPAPLSEGKVAEAGKEITLNKDAVDAWFVDLFVRCNNERAAEMYERMGYSVFRRVVE